MLTVFQRLKALREFERDELGFARTLEDRELIFEIGLQQALGTPLTVKQVFLLRLGSVPTMQRRLARLRRLGVIQRRRADGDRRSVELLLAPKVLESLARYGALFAEPAPARRARA